MVYLNLSSYHYEFTEFRMHWIHWMQNWEWGTQLTLKSRLQFVSVHCWTELSCSGNRGLGTSNRAQTPKEINATSSQHSTVANETMTSWVHWSLGDFILSLWNHIVIYFPISLLYPLTCLISSFSTKFRLRTSEEYSTHRKIENVVTLRGNKNSYLFKSEKNIEFFVY